MTSRRSRGMRHVGLNGIDISSWQEDLVVSAMESCDFVIVKATGGAGYSNECFRRHADETLAAGKLLGCYHYALLARPWIRGHGRGRLLHKRLQAVHRQGDPVPGLGGGRAEPGTILSEKVARSVRDKTGVTPGIYTSKSVCFAYDWSSVAKAYLHGLRSTRTTRRQDSSASRGPTAGTSARGTRR